MGLFVLNDSPPWKLCLLGDMTLAATEQTCFF